MKYRKARPSVFFRGWSKWIRIGVLVVGLLVGTAMWFEENFIYFPSPYDEQSYLARPVWVCEEYFTASDGTRLHGWYYPVQNADCVVLLSHGNAGNVADRNELALLIKRHLRASVFVYDYRGYGRSQGRPSEKGLYRDALAAYQHLTEVLGTDPQKVVLWGESLGSGVSIELACHVPHRAVVLQAPFTSLPDVAGRVFPLIPLRLLMRNRFDNLTKIQKVASPKLIIHGTADSVVPFDMSEKLIAACSPPKKFIAVPQADHNDLWLVASGEVWKEIAQFLSEQH
ncbi:MAG: alpha/beta hydrolase [Pirellulaceae bacterium]|nr:MAG: alpha/beta hydrolase [Pirellulaceae bacterium]